MKIFWDTNSNADLIWSFRWLFPSRFWTFINENHIPKFGSFSGGRFWVDSSFPLSLSVNTVQTVPVRALHYGAFLQSKSSAIEICIRVCFCSGKHPHNVRLKLMLSGEKEWKIAIIANSKTKRFIFEVVHLNLLHCYTCIVTCFQSYTKIQQIHIYFPSTPIASSVCVETLSTWFFLSPEIYKTSGF